MFLLCIVKLTVKASRLFFLVSTVWLLASTICPVEAQNKSLDYYISMGLANSPLLKDFQNQIAFNSVDSLLIRANFKPQVTGISDNTLSPTIGGWGYDPILTNVASINELVGVTKVFPTKGSLESKFSSIRLLNQSIDNSKKITELELKRTITTQYITVYGEQQQLGFLTELSKILTAEEAIIKTQTQNNIYRQTDYLTFLVNKKQQELQIKQLLIQIKNDFATLGYICGIVDTEFNELVKPDIELNPSFDFFSSIYLRHFHIDSIKLHNDLALIKFSYQPKISVFANGGYSSSFFYQAYKNFGYSFGLSVRIPIYDGHQRKYQEQKIAYSLKTVSSYHDFFVNQHNQEIENLRQQLSATDALINDINEQMKYSETLIATNRKLLQTGDTKIPDFILSINNYMTSKNLLTQNSISRMQIINQLNYLYK